jgi:transcriptional regulator with XRE-family HTH domain
MCFAVQLPTGTDGFGVRLRTCRLLTGLLSQTSLAEKAGVSKKCVSYIEQGHSKTPEYDTVRKLAGALGVHPDWLWTGDGSVPELLQQADNMPAYRAGVAAALAGIRADAPKDLSDAAAGWWLVGHGHELERQATKDGVS